MVTPSDVAKRFGWSDKKVRRLLRKEFGRVGKGQRWVLAPDHVSYLEDLHKGLRRTQVSLQGATTTVRIPMNEKKLLQGLAQESHETMQEVMAKAVEAYRRQRLLQRANEAYAALGAHPERWAEEKEERRAWEATLSDDLESKP